MLAPGTQAPDADFSFHDGTRARLSDLLAQTNVVLYFYPADFTWGCTRQACSFSDHYADIAAQQATLIGVSADSAEAHRRFVQAYDLPFRLAVDRDLMIASAFDVLALRGRRRLRVTYVIDRKGIIRSAIHHELLIHRHGSDVVRALRTIQHEP